MAKKGMSLVIDTDKLISKFGDNSLALLMFCVSAERGLIELYKKLIGVLEFQARIRGLGDNHVVYRQIQGLQERLQTLKISPKGFDDDYENFSGEKYQEDEIHGKEDVTELLNLLQSINSSPRQSPRTNPFQWGKPGEGNN